MSSRTLARLDVASACLLGLWSLALLVVPLGPSRVEATLWLDHLAWGAFGGAALLSWGGRWLAEVADEGPIGPVRLWSAACLAALLLCFAASFRVGPRWRELDKRSTTQALSLEEGQALSSARSLGIQFLVIRGLLALGLGAGLRRLPRGKAA